MTVYVAKMPIFAAQKMREDVSFQSYPVRIEGTWEETVDIKNRAKIELNLI